jgi:hypothetical protein
VAATAETMQRFVRELVGQGLAVVEQVLLDQNEIDPAVVDHGRPRGSLVDETYADPGEREGSGAEAALGLDDQSLEHRQGS